MKLGQTRDLLANASSNTFSDRVEIKEGVNVHRVLSGPYVSKLVFWPTLVEKDGKKVVGIKSAQVPKEGSKLFYALASIDKEVRRMMGEEDPRSQFMPSTQYLYLIFDRADDVPVVKVAPYKFTIYKRLEEIQSELSTKDPTKLKNGLIFMYDVIIKKTIGDSRRARYTTSYSVDPDSENNIFMGQIPKELLNYTAEEIDRVLRENNLYEKIFTPEELKAIEECNIDLENETKPLTDDEIRMKLKEFPIYLQAKDITGKYYFPQNEKFIKGLETLEAKYLIDAPVDSPVIKEESTLNLKTSDPEPPQKEEPKAPEGLEGLNLKRWDQ